MYINDAFETADEPFFTRFFLLEEPALEAVLDGLPAGDGSPGNVPNRAKDVLSRKGGRASVFSVLLMKNWARQAC